MREEIHDGLNIRIRLNELNMSQASLATALGISEDRVQRMLKKRHLTTDVLEQVSKALGRNFFSTHSLRMTEFDNIQVALALQDNGAFSVFLIERIEGPDAQHFLDKIGANRP